jgi:cellulose synthase/poly-beta-1,6-N-acetylglucosamine synthase-like glycosyltransferase
MIWLIAALWLALVYTWFLYPGFIAVLSWMRMRHRAGLAHVASDLDLSITVLVTVHNGEKFIRDKIQNCLRLRYPADRLQILVASDGSTDRTHEIVKEFAGQGVELFVASGRVGKTGCQNEAWSATRGEVVVFTDGETILPEDALIRLAANFTDPRVGAVGVEWVSQSPCAGLGQHESIYWKYENALKCWESNIGILTVLPGSCMGLRRKYFRPMPLHVGEDCVLPLEVCSQGGLCRHDPSIVVTDEPREGLYQEFRIRSRMTLRNWVGILHYPRLVNPFLHPGIAFAIISHKLMRWLTPFFLLALLGTALFDRQSWPGQLTLASLALFFIASMSGLVLNIRAINVTGLSFAASFFTVNVGFFWGTLKAVCGRRVTAYRPSADMRSGRELV